MDYLIVLLRLVFTGLDSWYSAVKMRKRMQRQLGRKVEDYELVSIRAWMSATTSSDQQEIG